MSAPQEVVFGGTARKDRKAKYRTILLNALREYKNILIVNVDHVGSSQMQKVRLAIRGQGILVMGKNTIMRKVIRDESVANPKLAKLLPELIGNVGFVLTNGDLGKITKTVLESKVPAAAKSGALAPSKVVVPAGPTGLDPGQTAFFQALNIATKIQRGSIEIIADVQLLQIGDMVTSSHVAFLSKMNIKPFFYGFNALTVYEDGDVYEASVLDLDDDELTKKFMTGVASVAALSMEVGVPTQASYPHFVRAAFRNMLAMADQVGHKFPLAVEFFGPEKEEKKKGGDKSGSSSGSSSSGSSSSGSDSD